MRYGSPPRQDARCPRCDSLERHRALAIYLARDPNDPLLRGRVLVVSPDPRTEVIGRQNAEYLSIDLAGGRAMQAMDLTDLALPDDDRDLVIAFHVLEHIPNDRAAMQEIARVLRPTGRAILEVPLGGESTDERFMDAPSDVRLQHYGQADHVRLYGGRDFEARLRAVGLEPQAVRVGDALADDVVIASLDPDEVFYVATPRPAPGIERG
ncbi:MAG: methyltransferase domain-containing protein [Chloroflexota bacterium]